ncbi:ComF family protein [Marinobacterium mangrovicola]|uniref:ComF family protein n=1 Tax=Marinobacterium mangrovicola TaxID=1476959 RepID=A0A4R1G9A1_9GAMM|nr:ComF family protein [Marinobacterium mangrovicola]TCK03075.1 ComF family protein [Marinobacterium mangrovicola]
MKKPKVDFSLFFNQACFLCRAYPAVTGGLCEGCHGDLPWLISFCPRCAEPRPSHIPQDQPCGRCQKTPPHYDRVIAAFGYAFPLSQMIPGIKYHRRPALIGGLAATLSHLIEERSEHPPQLLLPVPMHPWQEMSRGFNQSALLAAELGKRLGIPVAHNRIKKVRRTIHQADLDRRSRATNLRGSFRVIGSIPERVAIVDDILTTGATANELAKCVKKAGAKEVEIWVLARTASN